MSSEFGLSLEQMGIKPEEVKTETPKQVIYSPTSVDNQPDHRQEEIEVKQRQDTEKIRESLKITEPTAKIGNAEEKGGNSAEIQKVDIAQATADLEQQFNDFLESFAKENGLDDYNIHQLQEAAQKMRLKGEAALVENNIRERDKVEQMRVDEATVNEKTEQLNSIVGRCNNGLDEIDGIEFRGKVQALNDELKKVNEAAERQGEKKIRSFLSADYGDDSFVRKIFRDRDMANVALESLRTTVQKIAEGIKRGSRYGY
ncbi:MAG: hypothetical protein WC659_04745 [Patescibacteria group bacterium]